MNITLDKIAEITGSDLKGDKNYTIEKIKSIETADEKSITYLADAAKVKLVSDSKAGCIILSDKLKDTDLNYTGNILFSKDPHWAFVVLLRHFHLAQPKQHGAHPTAVIDPTAKLGKFTYIGANCIIEQNAVIGDFAAIEANSFVGKNVRIGSNCILRNNVTVKNDCVLGDRCIIHSGVVIGSDGFGYIQRNDAHLKIPQIGIVRIENDVEIGANTTIDRAALEETIIGEGTKIDNLVQIAHNVKIGKHCIIVAQAGIAGSSTVGDGTIISGQAGVSDHITIGKKAIIIAQSGVMGKIGDGEVVFGSPARPHIEAMKIQAILKKLPKMYAVFKKLKQAEKK